MIVYPPQVVRHVAKTHRECADRWRDGLQGGCPAQSCPVATFVAAGSTL